MVSRSELIAELIESGVRCTPENIIGIAKLADGKIVFLETGNSKAGLQHILENHTADFANKGILPEQIPDAAIAAVTQGIIVGYLGSGRKPRPIYQLSFLGTTQYIAVTVSDNGFIVGANPTSFP